MQFKVYCLFIGLFFFCHASLFAQDKKPNLSETSKFIRNAEFIKCDYDFTKMTAFKSGEWYIEFYPAYISNLKTGTSLTAIKFESEYSAWGATGYEYGIYHSGYLDMDEVKDFIVFLEAYVLPNDKKAVDVGSGVEYTFYSKELEIEFIREKRKSEGINSVASMVQNLNFKSYDRPYEDRYYTFSRKLRKLPELIEMLKSTVKRVEEN
ncbi:hypothetical protein [Marinifilum caeruleilacunae]|uniref:DUF4468 domain-containing protein n=1 Tax=Marinifilum caeruleilacunae TaxID=2499076 RepID=A0ABX1WU48_9BACT|nr:hypothetical protein [Marinifilum caeruleilacunae]NOU59635.1 hypothetical protein [Marinifilum caeruleilacunae]